jgi:hypothetical protein
VWNVFLTLREEHKVQMFENKLASYDGIGMWLGWERQEIHTEFLIGNLFRNVNLKD